MVRPKGVRRPQPGEDVGRLKFATREELILTPLSCWAHLSPEQYRERVAGLVEEIEADARAERESRGVQPLGTEAILKQAPHTWPNQTKKSPAPASIRRPRRPARPSGWRTRRSWPPSGRPPTSSRLATAWRGSRWARFRPGYLLCVVILPCRRRWARPQSRPYSLRKMLPASSFDPGGNGGGLSTQREIGLSGAS